MPAASRLFSNGPFFFPSPLSFTVLPFSKKDAPPCVVRHRSGACVMRLSVGRKNGLFFAESRQEKGIRPKAERQPEDEASGAKGRTPTRRRSIRRKGRTPAPRRSVRRAGTLGWCQEARDKPSSCRPRKRHSRPRSSASGSPRGDTHAARARFRGESGRPAGRRRGRTRP